MFVNFIWAGPPPQNLTDLLVNPIKLKRILNRRAEVDPPALWPGINLWCFRQFHSAFEEGLRKADGTIPNPTPSEKIAISIQFIDDLLNTEAPKYRIDRNFNHKVKYCIAVSAMIKAFVLMKELVSPIVLIRYPGYVCGLDIDFQANFCFPVGTIPKFVRVEKVFRDRIEIVSLARYTKKSNDRTLFNLFKKHFNGLMAYTTQHFPQSSTSRLSSPLASPISGSPHAITANFNLKVSVPQPDAWLSFGPDTLKSKEILFHLSNAMCAYILTDFPIFFDKETYDDICDEYLNFSCLEEVWRSKGLPALKHGLVSDISRDQFKLLAEFYHSREINAEGILLRLMMIGNIIIYPYVEIGSFLFPDADHTFASPLWLFDDYNYVHLSPTERPTPDERYEMECLTEMRRTNAMPDNPVSHPKPYVIPHFKYGPHPGREVPSIDETERNLHAHPPKRTIQQYGIVKIFGTSNWRTMPPNFRDPSENSTLTNAVYKRESELRISLSEADDPTWRAFMERLNSSL